MARSSTAASKPANTQHDEDYVLPQASDIVMALRKLAAY
jgi:hypothetical protein